MEKTATRKPRPAFLDPTDSLAAAIHEHYRSQAKREGWEMNYHLPYRDLPEAIKDSNRAAAKRISNGLAAAALQVVSTEDSEAPVRGADEVGAIIAENIETRAEKEHEGSVTSQWQIEARE